MDLLVLILLIIVHFAFLFRIWSETGPLWAIGCLLIPFLTWLVAFLNWKVYRGYFLAELALGVVYVLLRQ